MLLRERCISVAIHNSISTSAYFNALEPPVVGMTSVSYFSLAAIGRACKVALNLRAFLICSISKKDLLTIVRVMRVGIESPQPRELD